VPLHIGGRGERRDQRRDRRQLRVGRRADGGRQLGHVLAGVPDEEAGLFDLLHLGDATAALGHAERVFLGGERGGGHDPPRHGERIRGLPGGRHRQGPDDQEECDE
jgi:hypothetical protein